MRDKSLILLGSTHHTAPLEVREKLALTEERLENLYPKLTQFPDLEECLLISTCNRVELYGVTPKKPVRPLLENFWNEFHGFEPRQFLEYGFWRQDFDALKHLFNVSTGLDSQMVGETEILGQLKTSYQDALKRKTVGPLLNRIFQKSFQASKWCRTHTKISRGQISIGNVSVDLAMRIFGDLKNCRTLVIGTGEVGQKTLQSLKSRGVEAITITSRYFENAKKLAHEVGGSAIDFTDFRHLLPHFDLIVTCTAAPLPILTQDEVMAAMGKRSDQPLFIIDLAVPRDVDPKIDLLPNVYLYNIEDLAGIAQENLKARQKEMQLCQKHLEEKAKAVWERLVQPVCSEN